MVSHIIEKIDFLKDSMYIKIKILDTPCGINVKKFIDDGVPLYSPLIDLELCFVAK